MVKKKPTTRQLALWAVIFIAPVCVMLIAWAIYLKTADPVTFQVYERQLMRAKVYFIGSLGRRAQ